MYVRVDTICRIINKDKAEDIMSLFLNVLPKLIIVAKNIETPIDDVVRYR